MNGRSLQEWVHWLEVGAGGRWVARAALVLGVVVLSLRVGYTQFHGPRSEQTLAQAVVARQLVAGEGFTTTVNYPQTVAWLQEREAAKDRARPVVFDPEKAFPELHHAPLYPLVIAGTLALFPGQTREKLFSQSPTPPDGFGADYVLLALNVALLWVAALQTFFLGRRLFDEKIATLATLGLLLSASIWSETVGLGGAPLMMVLLLAFFQQLLRIEEAAVGGRSPWLALGGAGIVGGLLFLADYAAAAAWLGAGVWLWTRFAGRMRLAAAGVVALGVLLVAGPWIARNVALTGSPVALAWQGIALKAGDPLAEPETVRATFSAESPAVDLNKLGNKMLTSLQASLRERLWSGGGLFFSAFFVTGLLYRFREDRVNRLRWLFVATLALLMVAQAFFDSGEGERLPIVYATPLIAIFGAGFFAVLVASHDWLHARARWAAAALLALQALPLVRDVAEPRRLHFSYPPYYPGLFLSLRDELGERGGRPLAWIADVPAGAAWYSGRRVWAQPATLGDFHRVCQEQAQTALVLTPHTLDRPFFAMLTKRDPAGEPFGDWAEVYRGLVTGRFPAGFPLNQSQKVADNFYVLLDPLAMRGPASGR
jgi:hypothetical protein